MSNQDRVELARNSAQAAWAAWARGDARGAYRAALFARAAAAACRKQGDGGVLETIAARHAENAAYWAAWAADEAAHAAILGDSYW